MAEQDDTDKPETDETLLERAKKRFKLAQEAEQKQREREHDDLRFQVPEEQWDPDAKRQRLGGQESGVPIPGRPMLSIPKLDQPVQLVVNQQRQAHLGVNIQPLSPEAGSEVATILEGLYRRIERDSHAHIARSWAFDRAVKCGRGAYRVNTMWDESGGDDFDQVITIERILYQDAVYFDPAATKADFSDGEWAFVTGWMPLAKFKREFPEAEISVGETMTFEDLVRETPDWVREETSGEGKAILVAEYWYKAHESKPMKRGGQKRDRDIVTVKVCKLTGSEILEENDWNGHYIPLIPVFGRELQPYDGQRRWTGIIGPAKDAQRLYNYAASTAVELAALEPKAPYIIAEGQTEGLEDWWQQANIRNFPYLPYKPKTVDGQLAPPPQRAQVDVGRLGPSMQLLAQADNFIQMTTATFDPSLGRVSQQEKSGRAIMALQQQSDSGNSNYLQNLAEISMTYEAKVVLDLIPAIYDRPGRLARTLDEEGEAETIMLNQRFYHDPRSKQPVPLKPTEQPPVSPAPGPGLGAPPPAGGGPGMIPPGGPPPGMPPQPPQPPMSPPAPPEVKHYDLRKGIYSVAVDIGKQRTTALQEGSEAIGQILQSNPQLMPLIGPTWMKFQSWPGARELADILAKMRDKQFPGLVGGEDGQPSPEQMAAQMQQMGQQLQAIQAQLQAAMKTIETEQIKSQAALQKAEMDNQTKLQIAGMEQQSKVMLEHLKGELEQIRLAIEGAHESRMKDADRAHETAMAVAAPILQPPDLGFKGPNEMPLETPE